MMHVYLWGAGKRLAEVYDCLDLDRKRLTIRRIPPDQIS
jgi:hypothetical protein